VHVTWPVCLCACTHAAALASTLCRRVSGPPGNGSAHLSSSAPALNPCSSGGGALYLKNSGRGPNLPSGGLNLSHFFLGSSKKSSGFMTLYLLKNWFNENMLKIK
jgi:hypothetical protein